MPAGVGALTFQIISPNEPTGAVESPFCQRFVTEDLVFCWLNCRKAIESPQNGVLNWAVWASGGGLVDRR
jgi:hypothetical protein